jgi:hypothetical protein
MTVFDQRHQKVKYQYNIAGDINLDAVQNRADLIEQLEKLQAELARATQQGAFDEEGIKAKSQVEMAVHQAQKPEPDKNRILDYLNQARDTIAGVATTVTAATGLLTALQRAVELAQKVF